MSFLLVFAMLGAGVRAEEGAAFKAMDKDGDAKLSAGEFAAKHKEWFGKLDADRDGKLSSDEFVQAYCRPGGKLSLPEPACALEQKKRFAEADKDQSGTLSEAEYLAAVKGLFSSLDKDSNRALDPSEFSAKPYAAPVKGVLFKFKTGRKGGKKTAPKPEERKQGDGR